MIESQSEEGFGEEEQGHEGQGNSPERLPRARTLMTPTQLEGLQTLWEETRFPSTVARERLGERISLTSRKVQVWFQNQRSKHRRMESERLNPIQPSFSQHNHLSNPSSSFNTAYDARVQHQPPPPPPTSSFAQPSASRHRDWNENPSPPTASTSSSHHQLPSFLPPPQQHPHGPSSSSVFQPPPFTPFFPPGTWEDPSRQPYAPPLFPSRSEEDHHRSTHIGAAGMSRGRSWGEDERPRSSGGGAVWVDRVRRPDGASRSWDAGEQQRAEEARTGSSSGPSGHWVPNSYTSIEGGQFGRDASRQFHHERPTTPLPPPLLPRSSAGLDYPGPPSSSGSHQTTSSSPTLARDPPATGSDISLPSFRDFLLASTPFHPNEVASSPQHPRPATYPPHTISPNPYDGPSPTTLKRKQPSSTAATDHLPQPFHPLRPPSGLLLPPPPPSTSPTTGSRHAFPPASYSTQYPSHYRSPNPPPPPPHTHHTHVHQHHHHAPSPSLTSSFSSFSKAGDAHPTASTTPGRTPSPLEEEARSSEPRIVRPRGGMGSNGSHEQDEDEEEEAALSGESVGSEEKEKAVVKRVWEGIGMNGIERT